MTDEERDEARRLIGRVAAYKLQSTEKLDRKQ